VKPMESGPAPDARAERPGTPGAGPAPARPFSPRVRHNDHTVLEVPGLGEWSPRLSVSVLVPAYGDQWKLDLTLAALAAQTYPAHLMEVVVVDDGSAPPLRLPEIRPERTRLLSPDGKGWGSSLAVHTAARAADGDVLHRLDADMLVYREHIEATMRWHHLAGYLVVLGNKRFVDLAPDRLSPAEVRAVVGAGGAEALFDGGMTSWQEEVAADTDGLRDSPHRAYRVCNGATISFTPALYDACGGMDTGLALGADVEIGYRMAQAGAVFVPEPQARAWHLGIPQMRGDRREEGKRFREPGLGNRLPLRRDWRRRGPGRQWLVPYAEVVVEAAGASFEDVRAAVTAALAGTLPDVAVTIVAPWGELDAECRTPLDDPLLDLRLILETFRYDGRVRLRESVPVTAAPAPYRFHCPPGWMLAPDGLARLIELSDQDCQGVIYCALPRGADLAIGRLDRTQALARARLLRAPGEDVDDAVHEMFGTHWIDGTEWALVPVSGTGPGRGAAGPPGQDAAEWKRQAGKWRWRADHWKKEARKWEREATGPRAGVPPQARRGLRAALRRLGGGRSSDGGGS
jgi:GT2 family glycosyltransferase